MYLLPLSLGLLSVCVVDGLSVSVKPGSMECFIVTASTGTHCFGSFQILSSDPEPISITVVGPAPAHTMYHESRYRGTGAIDTDETEGSFAFDADLEGDYNLCISNGNPQNHDGHEKLVAFNFRTVDSTGDTDYEFASLQSDLLELQKGLTFLKDHQSFMNQREDVHKTTLESTNVKVLCWTVVEAVILVGMMLWQLTYISKFFETKRKL